MWGWMSAAGPGELAFIPGRANGHTYRDVLHNILLPTVRMVYPQSDVPEFYFYQDNYPIHRARVVQEWLREQPQIITVPWPSRSANSQQTPIENLWGLIVQKWDNRAERTKEALATHCEQVSDVVEADLNGTEDQLLLIVTGGAGSGKSYLLKLLVEYIVHCNAPTVDPLLKPKFVEEGIIVGNRGRCPTNIW
ncbi:hypothetical protein HW555_005054 [Spodoptera exigua]|uniref:Tc1-like transposase DDE domain-containing protein n=1 Tax=Spodoptera exigua TaxID=7107 RepID=A0A835GIZ5_SPOEX|nr:hypothetical protein HW555_005054 [Spodoptera exigua]